MRRPRRHRYPIEERRGEAGSIVLEAALILPLFLFVLLFLILMVRLSLIQMALHDAAAQTVKQTAAHLYPAWLAAGSGGNGPGPAGGGDAGKGDGSGAGAGGSGSGGAAGGHAGGGNAEGGGAAGGLTGSAAAELTSALAEWLPSPAGEVLSALASGDWKPAVDMAASEFGAAAVLPLVRELSAGTPLEPERIGLSRLSLPDLTGEDQPMLRLELKYDVPLGLPFTKRSFTIRAAAAERAWIPDSVPAAPRDGGDGEEDRQLLRIVGMEPVPARPGRKAKLIVQTDPGASVSLSVHYKSGLSRAKHLGDATAGEDGIVVWEWLVSGNTTPGTWELAVTAPEGGRAGFHFDVEKKGRP